MSKENYPAGHFSQRSYDESDKYAKDKLVDVLHGIGHTVINSGENTYYDIRTNKGGEVYNFEVETKWGRPFTTRNTFLFDTVSFLGRKKRLHDIGEFYYVIICPETEWALYANSTEIFQDQYKQEIEINSRDRYGKDLMYRVPRESCYFFDTNR